MYLLKFLGLPFISQTGTLKKEVQYFIKFRNLCHLAGIEDFTHTHSFSIFQYDKREL
jgi:hypothetical protein